MSWGEVQQVINQLTQNATSEDFNNAVERIKMFNRKTAHDNNDDNGINQQPQKKLQQLQQLHQRLQKLQPLQRDLQALLPQTTQNRNKPLTLTELVAKMSKVRRPSPLIK